MKLRQTLFAAVLTLAVPAVASAQVCLGLPQGTRTSAQAQIGFPSHATNFGVAGTMGIGEQLYAGASYTLTSFDHSSIPSQNTFGVHGAYDMPGLIEGASFCPTAGVNFSKWDEFSTIAIPVGVGIGKTFPLGEGTTTITPYATPQLVWARTSFDGASVSDTNFGFDAGGTVGFSRYFAGASFSKVFVTGSEAAFSIHGGIAF
jgi:hypothetical protein